ncbi:HPP family-domain-containing protein [Morchella snyderi]|nr:HPP family-domain-containing protein [Morchella snyderi]
MAIFKSAESSSTSSSLSSSSSSPSHSKNNNKPRLSRWLTWNYNFDIDKHLNPYILSGPRLIRRFPDPIRHILGYRNELKTEKESDLVIWLLAFVGAFVGVIVLETVFMHWPEAVSLGCPIIIGSYGAAAILLYNAIDSPLSQPRNAFFGQLISALTGIVVSKLFAYHPRFETEYIWLAGALACALASVLMGVTRTVHPPAGATALLAAVDDRVRHMGWFLVPVVVISSALMIAVALVFGNIQRTYPRHWWTAGMVGKDLRASRRQNDVEVGSEKVEREQTESEFGEKRVVIEGNRIQLPEWLVLGEVERDVLETVRGRIQAYDDAQAERLSRMASDDSKLTL